MSSEIIDFPRKPRPPGLLALAAGWTGTLRRGLDVDNNRAHAASFARQIVTTPARSHAEMMHKVHAAQTTAALYLGDDHPVTCFLNSAFDDCAALKDRPSRELRVPDIDLLAGAGAGETN